MPHLATRAPSWVAHVDEALTVAVRKIHLLAAATPTNAESERARLCDAATRDAPLSPAWIYAPHKPNDTRARLERVAKGLETLGEDPLAKIYLARALELTCEAELCEAVGSPRFAELAAARFKGDLRSAAGAQALTKKWKQTKTREDTELIASDSDDPDSLLSIMKREIGKRALPFRISVHRPLSSLAATGDGVILIACGRAITKEAALRTVLHEIEGHALPRIRASKLALAIFRIGTARGVDDQEGLALVLEERAGFLVGERRHDLAARAHAVEAMRGGGNFAEIVTLLKKDHGRTPAHAITIAERVFRGSDGNRPGLGRESVYLESFIRVRDRLEEFPSDENVLASGQVSVDAIAALAAHVVSGD